MTNYFTWSTTTNTGAPGYGKHKRGDRVADRNGTVSRWPAGHVGTRRVNHPAFGQQDGSS